MARLLLVCSLLLATVNQALASQLVYPAHFIAANLSVPSPDLVGRSKFARDIFGRASCTGQGAPCGSGCCQSGEMCCSYGFCAPDGNVCCTGNYNCAPNYGCCQPGSCYPLNGAQCCSDGSFCDATHYCGTCPSGSGICCFGQNGGPVESASRIQVITSTQTFAAFPTSTNSYTAGPSTSSTSSSVTSSSSVGSALYYTTFTYYQVIYYYSTDSSTTTMESSTNTLPTLLSVYASNQKAADLMFTSMESSIQEHASASTRVLSTPGPSPSSASSSGAAAAVRFSTQHVYFRADIPGICMLVLGGLAGVLAVVL